VRTAPKLLAAITVWHVVIAAAADDLWVDVDRSGTRFAVQATATVAAPVAVVWEVLTDYDNLASFIPGLSVSAVNRRSGNRLQVEQKGEARFLVFSYPIEVVLLRYTGELEPDFGLPPIIGTLAVRSMVEEQFGAMVAEIERRAAVLK